MLKNSTQLMLASRTNSRASSVRETLRLPIEREYRIHSFPRTIEAYFCRLYANFRLFIRPVGLDKGWRTHWYTFKHTYTIEYGPKREKSKRGNVTGVKIYVHSAFRFSRRAGKTSQLGRSYLAVAANQRPNITVNCALYVSHKQESENTSERLRKSDSLRVVRQVYPYFARCVPNERALFSFFSSLLSV